LEKPDVIVAFGFGKEEKTNFHIGEHARYLALKYGVPLFTQQDVAKSLKEVYPPKVIIAEENGQYLSTLGIVRAVKTMSSIYGWKHVAVVAAPCHERRCIRDLRKMGFSIVRDDGYLRNAYGWPFWYNKDDPQVWVHNPLIWWIREIVLRMMPWGLYSKIA
jgi:hypothetical protein